MVKISKKFQIYQLLINNFKQLMFIIIFTIGMYFYFLIILVSPIFLSPELNFLRTMEPRFVIPILLLFSIIFILSMFLFGNLIKLDNLAKFLNVDKIEKFIYSIYLKMFQFNSFFLIPFLLISIGFLFITFKLYNNLFFDFGVFLLYLGFILFYGVFAIKLHYERKILCMLQMTFSIFDDLSENKNNENNIKKFNTYFKKVMDNIDSELGKDLKINDLKIDEDDSLRVKNTIINFLPLYLKFGKQEQIDSLKNHIKSMSLLVEKDDEFSQNIIHNIIDIYDDINSFLNLKRFLITEKGWDINLSIIKDNSPIIFGTFQLIIFILYLHFYGPSPVP